jgi:hypothetical protein
MVRLRRFVRLAAAAASLSLVGAAAAQSANRYPPRVQFRVPQPQIDRALAEFGFDANRLRPEQQRALQSAWRDLLPDADPGRYALNSAQATAIVYLALVHGRDRRGGWGGDPRDGWNGGYGRGDGYGGGYDGGNGSYGRGEGYGTGASCAALSRRVLDAENATDEQDRTLFLDDEHKAAVRTAAREAQRMAVERGWRDVADRASDVVSAVSEPLPERTAVAARVGALQHAAIDACGGAADRR